MIPKRLEGLFAEGSPTQLLGERFAAAGKQLYLVGGSVRDAFLDEETKDLDFATEARPGEIIELLDGWADGALAG